MKSSSCPPVWAALKGLDWCASPSAAFACCTARKSSSGSTVGTRCNCRDWPSLTMIYAIQGCQKGREDQPSLLRNVMLYFISVSSLTQEGVGHKMDSQIVCQIPSLARRVKKAGSGLTRAARCKTIKSQSYGGGLWKLEI